MKKIFNWTFRVSLILISASVITYVLHYIIFHDVHHIFIYMIGDFGFLFLDVLLVILFIERILARREKRNIIKKLNMVIGAFFSEVGIELMNKYSKFVKNSENLEKDLLINPQWTKKDFKAAIETAEKFKYMITIEKSSELEELQTFLVGKQAFMLRLLENTTLLEHERFTDLLWAVSHLAEELSFRGEEIMSLPKTDLNHIKTDMLRAFSRLTIVWIAYIEHLKESYPFLFHLYARINPLNPKASPIVIENVPS